MAFGVGSGVAGGASGDDGVGRAGLETGVVVPPPTGRAPGASATILGVGAGVGAGVGCGSGDGDAAGEGLVVGAGDGPAGDGSAGDGWIEGEAAAGGDVVGPPATWDGSDRGAPIPTARANVASMRFSAPRVTTSRAR